MNENLKPCPFCGSDMIKLKKTTSRQTSGKYFQYTCRACGAQARAFGALTEREEPDCQIMAADAWNSRANTDERYDAMVLDISEAVTDGIWERMNGGTLNDWQT